MVTAAEQGRGTRARLMDAALESIADHGWGAVTTRMVADRAGLRPGLVHYHFTSVNDLLIDASPRMARQIGNSVVGDALTRPGAAGLEDLLTAAGAYAAADPDTRVFSEIPGLLSLPERTSRVGIPGRWADSGVPISVSCSSSAI
jgi:AcrR family transcriptional regulator